MKFFYIFMASQELYVRFHNLQFDEKVSESLEVEVEGILEAINNPSMKEVKGLEDRLFGLEQLMYGAHKLVQEQGDMAQVS